MRPNLRLLLRSEPGGQDPVCQGPDVLHEILGVPGHAVLGDVALHDGQGEGLSVCSIVRCCLHGVHVQPTILRAVREDGS